MRRNLTISFDPGFIERMDAQRGDLSRGRYLEGLSEHNGLLSDVMGASPYVTRVLEGEELERARYGDAPRASMVNEVQVDVSPEMHLPVDLPGPSTYVRIDEADADRIPMRRHAPTCSCAVCKPPKS